MRAPSALSRLLLLSVLMSAFYGCGAVSQCDNKRFEVPKKMRVSKHRVRNKVFAVPPIWAPPAGKEKSLPVDSLATLRWEPAWGHHSAVTASAISPDRSALLTAESHRQVILWSLPSLQVQRRWRGFVGRVRGLSLSSDGRRFAVLEGRSTLSVWSIEGPLLKRKKFSKAITSLRFASVENKLAITLEEGSLVLLHGASLEVASQQRPCTAGVGSTLLFEPLQAWMVVSCKRGGLSLLAKGTTTKLLPTVKVTSLSVTQNGRVLAVGGKRGRVTLLSQTGGKWKSQSLELAHLRGISALALSRDGARLVSAGLDRRISLWHLRKGTWTLQHWRTTKAPLKTLHWASQGRLLVGGETSGRVVSYNTRGEAKRSVGVAPTVSFHASFSLRGQKLALSGTRGDFSLWDLKTLKPVLSSTRQTAALTALQFSADGNHLLSVDPYNAVFWDIRSQILVDIVRPGKGTLFSFASLGSDWTETWFGTAQHGVQWWTIRGGPKPLFRHSKPQRVSAVAFQRLRRLGVAGTLGGEVFLYALRENERRLLRAKRLSKAPIRQLLFHPKKPEVAVVSGGALAILDKKLNPLATMTHHNTIQAVGFSPAGALVAIAGEEGDVRLWERSTKKVLRTLRGCQGMIRAVAFSPDTPVVAGACTDGFVYLWNSKNASLLAQVATLANKEWLVKTAGNRFYGSKKATSLFFLRSKGKLLSLAREGKGLFSKNAGSKAMSVVKSAAPRIKGQGKKTPAGQN